MGTQYSHLTLSDRLQLEALRGAGWSFRDIATVIGTSAGALNREVNRNCSKGSPYLARPAQDRYHHIRLRCAVDRRKLGHDLSTPAWQGLLASLQLKISPEQHAGRLRAIYFMPHLYLNLPHYVSHESVYRAIYTFPHRPTRNWLVRLLRQSRAGRRKRRTSSSRYTGLQNFQSIDQRDLSALLREIPGHWEGDLIKGKKGTSAVVLSLVERSSRYTVLLKLDNGSAGTVQHAVTTVMQALPTQLRLSLAYDRGSEMSTHELIARQLQMPVYICDAYSPWQRGTNENTNGLVRQYLPKGSDLTTLSAKQLIEVQNGLNHRPRKILGYYTAHERLAKFMWQLANAEHSV